MKLPVKFDGDRQAAHAARLRVTGLLDKVTFSELLSVLTRKPVTRNEPVSGVPQLLHGHEWTSVGMTADGRRLECRLTVIVTEDLDEPAGTMPP